MSTPTATTTLGQLMTNIESLPIMETLLFGTLTFLLLVLFYIQTRKDSLDLRYLILDSKTKKPSIHKIGQGLALVVSTWGFLVLIERNLLTEFYFTGYMVTWAGTSALNKWIDNKKSA